MQTPSPCLKVLKKQGEKTIVVAGKLGLIDKSLSIQHDENFICIPLTRQPKENEWAMLKNQVPEVQLASEGFTQKKPPTQTLMQAFENQLPPHLLASLPHSIDIIGDIVIIEIPAELKAHQNLIGQTVLKTHRNIKVVLGKAGAISGTYRTRQFTHIAGERRTSTIHREYGSQYHVDLAKAYFSPRLSHEHQRVASLVQSGEVVVDLFAGVGPFAVLIAKNYPDVKVYAVDLNPEAVELLEVNVRVNRVDNRVIPVEADAREIAASKLRGMADRVIMNLPETAIEFVDAACQALKPQGGIIHFYAFVHSPDTIENLQRCFSDAVEKAGRKVEAFLCAKNIRETAPYEWQVVLDTKIVNR